jgi:hypothetical protein
VFIFKFLAILASEVLRQRSGQPIAAQSPNINSIFLRRFLAPAREGGPEEIRMIYPAAEEKSGKSCLSKSPPASHYLGWQVGRICAIM